MKYQGTLSSNLTLGPITPRTPPHRGVLCQGGARVIPSISNGYSSLLFRNYRVPSLLCLGIDLRAIQWFPNANFFRQLFLIQAPRYNCGSNTLRSVDISLKSASLVINANTHFLKQQADTATYADGCCSARLVRTALRCGQLSAQISEHVSRIFWPHLRGLVSVH